MSVMRFGIEDLVSIVRVLELHDRLHGWSHQVDEKSVDRISETLARYSEINTAEYNERYRENVPALTTAEIATEICNTLGRPLDREQVFQQAHDFLELATYNAVLAVDDAGIMALFFQVAGMINSFLLEGGAR